MIPFQGLLFFYIMGLMLLPAAVLGLMGRSLKVYGMAFTAAMLAIVFAENGQLWALVVFYLWQTALCMGFARVGRHRRPILLWMGVGLSLLPLIAVKVGEVLPGASLFALLGISYMTFRAVQVLIELYDGAIEGLNLLDFSYFLLFFPAVSSGPIDRFRRFKEDSDRTLGREAYTAMLRRGVWRLMGGVFYCHVLSVLIYRLWLAPLPARGLGATLLYMYGYTFYLFFNFAGYSAMAIGTAHILGVALPENFRQPFLSVDMKDFWSRWHISLSTWLRDYVYSRFVMWSLRGKKFKNPRTGSYIGYGINMMLMGMWHGLSPQYLAYGAYHGLLMGVNEALDLHVKPFRKWKRSGWPQVVCVLVTFHLFSFGLLIFSGRLF